MTGSSTTHPDERLLDRAGTTLLHEEIPDGPPETVRFAIARRLNSNRSPHRNRLPVRVLSAALLIAGMLLVILVVSRGNRSLAFEDVQRTFLQSRPIHFRHVIYSHAFLDKTQTTACRQVSVIESDFVPPGLSRELSFGHDGVLWKCVTKDHIRGVELELEPTARKAKLTEVPPELTKHRRAASSRITHLEEMLKSCLVEKDLGSREIHGLLVQGFRVRHANQRADFWVDPRTARIVQYREPSADVYDYENDPATKNDPPADNVTWGQELKGSILTDIVYDAPMDGLSFVLTPPRDFQVTHVRFRIPIEKDLVEWLEVFAQVNNGIFPDNENPPLNSSAESGRREALESKPAQQRTSWEETFLRGFVRQEDPQLYGGGPSVVVHFRLMFRTTWHYQGMGIKLGDAASPVCWYRPGNSETYRVIYGDLSVRNLSAEQLPKWN